MLMRKYITKYSDVLLVTAPRDRPLGLPSNVLWCKIKDGGGQLSGYL